MEAKENYQLFGKEWEKELMKLPKTTIISMYRNLIFEFEEHKYSDKLPHLSKLKRLMPSDEEIANKCHKLYAKGDKDAIVWIEGVYWLKQQLAK